MHQGNLETAQKQETYCKFQPGYVPIVVAGKTPLWPLVVRYILPRREGQTQESVV